MDFNSMTNQAATETTTPTTETVTVDLEKPQLPAEMQDTNAYQNKLMELPEVKALTNEIDIQDTNTVLNFGQKPAEEISKIADTILSGMRSVNQEEATEMMTQLTKLMGKFDVKDFEEMAEDKNFIAKFFGRVQSKFDKMFTKYEDLGKEVDQIAVILRKYMNDIQKTNTDLQRQYQAEIVHYQTLEKYIAAGKIALQEIDAFDATIDQNPSLDANTKAMQHQQLDMVRNALDTRVYELQTAENVAIQACPMIQTMQLGNYNLMRKINSSFIISLPIFKQCMIQAIQLRRQQIQAKAMSDLDEKTNELLLKNAKNTAAQSVQITKMSSTSAIKIETLRETANIITQGIADTKAELANQAQLRETNSRELDSLATDMKKTAKLA